MKDRENKVLMKQMLKFEGKLDGNLLQNLYEIKKSGGFSFKIEVFTIFSYLFSLIF